MVPYVNEALEINVLLFRFDELLGSGERKRWACVKLRNLSAYSGGGNAVIRRLSWTKERIKCWSCHRHE